MKESSPVSNRPVSSGHTELARHFTAQVARNNGVGVSAAEVRALADTLLRDVIEQRASDIHIEPMNDVLRVRLRVDGELLPGAFLPRAEGTRLLNHFKAIGSINPGPLFRPQEARVDYTIDGQSLDLRLTVIPCLDGETMVMRVLLSDVTDQRIGALGLGTHDLERLTGWLSGASGMLLVTGPTGSGKTTTVYSLLHELSTLNRAIFTIEDPVEYEIPGINQVPIDEAHQLSYSAGMRALLRMDPDYFMLGELRDAQSAEVALAAASRGTVVLSTLHSRDPFSAVTTFRNWDLSDNEVAVGLNLLIAQRLVRKLCPECRVEAKPTDDQRRWLTAAGAPVPTHTWQAGPTSTCSYCHGLGYRGRTGIFEIWQLDESDYDAILAGMDEHTLRRQVHDRHHGTMLDDGLEKARHGITSVDALRRVPDLLPLHALVDHSRQRSAAANARRRKGSSPAKKGTGSENHKSAKSMKSTPSNA